MSYSELLDSSYYSHTISLRKHLSNSSIIAAEEKEFRCSTSKAPIEVEGTQWKGV